jgi:hypothetical protein
MEHLAKLQVSPNAQPRAQWIQTILRSRRELQYLLEDSLSLR